ncbi:sigma 54-interacting transcriptional regulator [Enterococcus sp. BWT-B8]|uniref:sigma-54-dependent transcriptional regulator n=1 Tax=Enterococcus sp. BWT-B8 TaxID=2885157 RepID=UPI001E4417EA|nr:sigma-54-dependent transcriptional regulator [Enterococcus sp. BWT-B8]MCB5952320.1 sigma 54-interacting transcriptional regulator [Enterococcus sp. BWT-B8]
MEKRIDHILGALEECCVLINDEQIDSLEVGFTASDLSEKTGYSRNNVSRELKQLVLENRAIRIGGRPVLFLSRKLPGLKSYSSEQLAGNTFSSLPEFIESVRNGKELEKLADNEKENAFLDLIGSDKSMQTQVKQAIAGILYPPSGLNTLLIGETGVGKTTFANAMYRFAVANEKFTEDAPYILFNCADYSGNPQLLLSHLFGHVKGAFTGAEEEKRGLVSQANGGILFLDEIHRLPPEGQEMLFSLMDRGEYRRLGESATHQKADVLIIAATTEDPDEAILKTFLRRIPNVIKIPSLKERSMEERLELIYLYFKSEAKAINRQITVSTDVINFLLFYDCVNNLGQLINDIKLTTASAFSESLVSGTECLNIEVGNLPKHHFNFFLILEEQRKHYFDWNGKEAFDFYPDDAPSSIEELVTNFQQESAFYKELEKNSKKYFEKGIAAEEIRRYVDTETMKYFGNAENGRIYQGENEQEKPIYKIIPEEEYHFLFRVIEETLSQQKIYLNNQAMIGLMMHLKNVISKIQGGSYNSHSRSEVKQSKALSYQIMAEKIIHQISQHYHISVPAYEVSMIALFLNSLDLKNEEKHVGILVIAHGNYAAKDIAAVANKLLQVKHCHAICMPLEASVSEVLEQSIEMVRQIDEGKGVLLLVDMGSLTTFGEIITEETGSLTRTLSCVSTPYVLEATRLALSNSYDIDEILNVLQDNGKEYSYVASSRHGLPEVDTQKPKIKEKIFHLIEETTTFINVDKVSKLLEDAYQKILEQAKIQHTDSLYIKYIFHTVTMLERAIQKNTLRYYNFDEKISEFESIYEVIEKEFQVIEASFGIQIDKDEIAYVAEIFYFSNINDDQAGKKKNELLLKKFIN